MRLVRWELRIVAEQDSQRATKRVPVIAREVPGELALDIFDERTQALTFGASERRQRDAVAPRVGSVAMPFDESSTLHAGHQVRDRRSVEVDLVAELALARIADAVERDEDRILHARDLRRHDARPRGNVRLLGSSEEVAGMPFRLSIDIGIGHRRAAER